MGLRTAYLSGLPHKNRDGYRARVLLELARKLAGVVGMKCESLDAGRLFQLAEAEMNLGSELLSELGEFARREPAVEKKSSRKPLATDAHLWAAHRLGQALDMLLAVEVQGERKRHGSYFTPVSVARTLVDRAVQTPGFPSRLPSVCDPACGGGAFLLEAARALFVRALQCGELDGDRPNERREICRQIHGVDRSSLSVAVVEAAFWLFCGDDDSSLVGLTSLRVGDALVGRAVEDQEIDVRGVVRDGVSCFDFFSGFPRVFSSKSGGFDWIVGNPPWVAFQGRATQKIPPGLRAYYRSHFRAFKGYPTLHGLFVERSTQIAPCGAISLLVPSSVSDLDGYAETRASLRESHEVAEPLLEFGQDAFDGVIQPCFGLIATTKAPNSRRLDLDESRRAWVLEERSRASGQAVRVAPPEVLARVSALPTLPRDAFREMGFQSNRVVAQELFYRGDLARGEFLIPLLEGRRVQEFTAKDPALFLNPNEEVLKQTKCRLRRAVDYEGVDFVVRQTAAFTIAAPHNGHRFRNSLIGGFSVGELDSLLLLGLLNSALYRAFHVAGQRDARQMTFPQVKLGHLRRLPEPPIHPLKRDKVRQMTRVAIAKGGLTREGRLQFDRAVFDLFDLNADETEAIVRYLKDAAPKSLAPSIL